MSSKNVSRVWKVWVASAEYYWLSIDFDETHPSPYPDTFTIILSGEIDTIHYFDYVEIKKNNVLKFYGYVEKIKWTSNKDTLISGRCRKVIAWKKQSERFSDPKVEGFFGKVYPEELLKFILRCPTSEIPPEEEEWIEYPLCKVGWGMNPKDWACIASSSSMGTDPIYPRLRVKGFCWRNRGDDSNWATLLPNGTSGSMDWNENGCTGKDCIDAEDSAYISRATGGGVSYAYSMGNLGATADSVKLTKLNVKIRMMWTFTFGTNAVVKVEVYDGSTWWVAGYINYNCAGFGNGPWWVASFNISSILDTITKINSAKIRFTKESGSANITARIDYAYLRVDYSTYGTQEVGDYYRVDLGSEKTRVSGLVVQSRLTSDSYPRNYRVQTATEDFDGALGNQYAKNKDNSPSYVTLANSDSMFVCGPWTMPATKTIEELWAFLKINVAEVTPKFKGVIYRQVLQDYDTDYTEVEPDNRIVATDNHIDFTARRDEDAYLYRDFGAGYFDKFIHEFEFKVVTNPVPDDCDIILSPWAVTNSIDDLLTLEFGNIIHASLSVYRDPLDIIGGGAPVFRLYRNNGAGGSAIYSAELTEGTTYYIRMRRQGSTLYCDIYTSAANREACTSAFANLSRSVGASTYQYMFACATFNASQSFQCECDIDNLAIFSEYERLGVSDQVTLQPAHEGWVLFIFSTPVSATNGDKLYIGVCSDNIAAWQLQTYNYASNFIKPYITENDVTCSPPDPFGEQNDFDCGYYPCVFVNYGGNWTTRATVSSNIAQDIVHSWQPASVRYIKIQITSVDLSHGWEITQIYIYQSDIYKYCIMGES